MESPVVEEWTSQDGRLAYWVRHPEGGREFVVTEHELSLPTDRLTRIKNRIQLEVVGVSS